MNRRSFFRGLLASAAALPFAAKAATAVRGLIPFYDNTPRGAGALYSNRALRAALDVQAIRDKNVLLSDYTRPNILFRELPIRVVDDGGEW